MFYWRWWTLRLQICTREVLYRGTRHCSLLSLALTKPKEKLLCEENMHLLLWFTGSQSISPCRTGSMATIQRGLVLYKVDNWIQLPGIYLVGQRSRLECVLSRIGLTNSALEATRTLEPVCQPEWYIFGYYGERQEENMQMNPQQKVKWNSAPHSWYLLSDPNINTCTLMIVGLKSKLCSPSPGYANIKTPFPHSVLSYFEASYTDKHRDAQNQKQVPNM